MKLKAFLFLSFLFITTNYSKENISIIPKPLKLEISSGEFVFNQSTKIWIDPGKEMETLGNYFTDFINHKTGLKLLATWKMTQDIPKSLVRIEFKNDFKNDEAYSLSIKPNVIKISAKTGAGIFYAFQTLFQLFSPNERQNKIQCLNIYDEPRFQWRGAHLDVCRHFFPIEFVKKYIDILSMYKMNRFHWHLTEDQGWRIEIKKYPKLTEIGAWRKDINGNLYGGFYTQEQIKDVIEYAKKKYITIIPEIEMPGHSVAALSAYPELSCSGGPFEVETNWGIFKDVFCAGNDSTFNFLQNILSEVIDLFPSDIIHIGGDEVPKDRWKECLKCQLRMKTENLKDEHELQSYFIHRIEKFVNSKGKKIIGWDEILEGGLAPNALVMSWRGVSGGIAAAKEKHYVVMSPGTHCYFDHYQALQNEPKAIGGYTSLEKVYSYEPIPSELNDDEAKYILGAQANLWTEYIETTDHVEYMLLPRLIALSEVVWSDKNSKNLDDFLSRIKKHYDLLISKNINFRIPTPLQDENEILFSNETKVVFNKPIENSKIFFTIDGTEPTTNSIVYKEPLVIENDLLIKAKTFLPNGKSSSVSTVQFSKIDSTFNGIFYKYFEGVFDSIPNFSNLKPTREGKIYKLNLRELKPEKESFAVSISGYINIEKDDNYKFYLSSDDGSKLLINNKILIDNDGSHSLREMTNSIFLTKGKVPFEIQYFNKWGSSNLKLEFETSDSKRKSISANMLLSN
ncbi:MAG: family 20 glycosylhydrolase [Melioribacteraceae bacterium]|nr:family 20 glycosylhydrolase [Melioribacteraceae bacterium]